MPFEKGYRHFQRYRRIANVFAAQGLGFVVDSLGLSRYLSLPFKKNEAGRGKSLGARLRYAFQELGPTFVKLGQLLSTRPDLLPEDIIKELTKLQDEVPPFPFEQVKATIEAELNKSLQEVFAEFAKEPLAAASIGQVHRAMLKDGAQVVVKVQRPGVQQIVETDLQILYDLARVADRHTPFGELYDFVEMVEEFEHTIKEELNYSKEGRNADRLRANLAEEEKIYIPEIYWEYTTPKVLTMEYVHGVKLSNSTLLEAKEFDRSELAATLTKAMLKQILVDGFFHADPHPGNLAALPGNILVFMDFGMVGKLSESRKEQFIALVIGLARKNSKKIVDAVLEMGIVGEQADLKELRRDVDKMRDHYYDLSFKEINLGEAIMEILQLAFKYKIKLPPEFTLLAKALLTVEGVAQELDPELSIMEIAEPYAGYLLRRRLEPRRLIKNLGENLWEIGGFIGELPQSISSVLEKIGHDRIKLKLEVENFKDLQHQLDRIVNRLSLSIVLLSFSIVMAGLVISSALGADNGSQFFWNLPILEIGFVVASVMVIWLIWSIFRSGRF